MQQNDVSLSCIGRCIAEIIEQEVRNVVVYSRCASVHACTFLAIAISALKQAMGLKQAPFYSFWDGLSTANSFEQF